VESIEESAIASSSPKLIDAATVSDVEAVQAMETLLHTARGKTIAILRSHSTDSKVQRNKALAWECIERYCTSWFGLEIVPSADSDAVMNADIIIIEKLDGDASNPDSVLPPVCRVLFVHERLQHPDKRSRQDARLEETISMPIGPFKMARALLALFEGRPPRHKSFTFDYSSVSSLPMSSIQMPLSVLQNPAIQPTLQGTVPFTIPTQTPPADESLPLPLKDLNRPILPSHSLSQPGPSPPALPLPAENITHPSLPTIPTLASFSPRSHTSSPRVSPAQIAALSSAPTTGSTTPLRILAVDDNNLNLQLLKRYLGKRANDLIITAVNGFEALQRVKDQPAFDVILMDISMPIMDGFEATRLIRKWENEHGVGSQESQRSEMVEKNEDEIRERESKTAYVVALTGLASRRDRDEAEKCGFDDFFTKPISFGLVGQLLGRLSREKANREGV
jgi:CheY-like chemotaxis protein